MKTFFRNFLVNSLCFWIISSVLFAIDYSSRLEILLFASLALTVINILVKPLLNLLFLPINLITLGTFKWIINVIALYLVTLFVPEFKIKSFVFPGINFHGFIIPQIAFNLFLSYLVVSFLLSIISDLILFIFK